MGLGTLIRRLIKRDSPGAWSVNPFNIGRPYIPPTRYAELVKRYTGWVYACAHINAVSCAQIPLRLYATKETANTKFKVPTKSVPIKRAEFLAKSPTMIQWGRKAVEVVEVTEHPFIELMESVNPDMNQFDLLELLFLFIDLTGNEYWHLTFSPFGVPIEIWPLFPQFMEIIPDKTKYVSGYEYKVWNETHFLKPEEVVHFKNPNPQNQYYGLGPLQAAVVSADLSTSMNTYEAALFQNRAQPDMALVLPPEAGNPSPDSIKEMYGRWKQRFGGNRKQGKLAILTGGAELKQLSLSPKEMSFLKGREATITEVAAIFGVPLSKLTTKDVNLANAQVGEKQYQQNSLLPRLRKVEQKINEKIMPLYGNTNLFVAFDNPVDEDLNFAVKERESNITIGFTTINEEREKVGLEPVEWGDVPLNQTAEPSVPEEPEKRVKAPRKFPPLEHPTNFVNEPFVEEMVRYLDMVESKALDALDARGEMLVQKTPLDDWMSEGFDMIALNADLDARLRPFIRSTIFAGGRAAVRSVIDDIQFNELAPQVTRALRDHRIRAVTQINSTQAKELRAALAEGMAEGEGIPNLRKRVQSAFSEQKTRYEAERIARTETIWAWNEGAVQGYVQSGVVTRKVWVTAFDDRTCQWCEPMDGRVVGVETNFFEQGEQMLGNEGGVLHFDFEQVNHPPLHPQCLTGDTFILPRGDITGVSKRWYNGKVVTVKTAGNRVITCTPNHPILSGSMFVPANSLNVGNKVVCSGRGEGETFSNWKNINKPSLIEDVAETFFANSRVLTKEVPLSAPDFHGDGVGSEVAIIGADSLLHDGSYTAFLQHIKQNNLGIRDIRRILFDRFSVLALGLKTDSASFSGLVSRLNLVSSFLRRHLRPLEGLGFALSAESGPVQIQNSAYPATGVAKAFSNSVFRPSTDVQMRDFGVEFFSDSIVHVSTSNFNGYVYNLETTESYYISGGIASHNCRCTVVAETEDF